MRGQVFDECLLHQSDVSDQTGNEEIKKQFLLQETKGYA